MAACLYSDSSNAWEEAGHMNIPSGYACIPRNYENCTCIASMNPVGSSFSYHPFQGFFGQESKKR